MRRAAMRRRMTEKAASPSREIHASIRSPKSKSVIERPDFSSPCPTFLR